MSLSRLPTISHDFCTTSDVFWNKKEFVLLNHGHYLILPRERNTYDATVMIVHFSTHSCTFSGKHSCPQNAIIRVEVCGALGWFLYRN